MPPKWNKRFLSREDLVDQIAQEQVRRKNAEERDRYWRKNTTAKPWWSMNQSNRGTYTVCELTKPFIRLLTTVESAQRRNFKGNWKRFELLVVENKRLQITKKRCLLFFSVGFSITKRRITHWPFKRCLLGNQIRLNAVEVIRLLHNTLTLKEAEVALNTDIYYWTWPHKWLRLTVSPNEVLFCKLSALRVYHVDIKHRDLYMTSKISRGSFFLQNAFFFIYSSPAF